MSLILRRLFRPIARLADVHARKARNRARRSKLQETTWAIAALTIHSISRAVPSNWKVDKSRQKFRDREISPLWFVSLSFGALADWRRTTEIVFWSCVRVCPTTFDMVFISMAYFASAVVLCERDSVDPLVLVFSALFDEARIV